MDLERGLVRIFHTKKERGVLIRHFFTINAERELEMMDVPNPGFVDCRTCPQGWRSW